MLDKMMFDIADGLDAIMMDRRCKVEWNEGTFLDDDDSRAGNKEEDGHKDAALESLTIML